MASRWIPAEMKDAPPLDAPRKIGPMRRKYALLINPFYAKDPHASFGKHVLTPSLALTSVAAGTPYPGTPLFAEMESQGRLLHKNWSLYDTAHVVFQPRHMTPEQLAEGYAWCYERLFSHGSIWRRRPRDARAVLPYLAMSYLYKRSNRVWHWLIRNNVTAWVWRPLVEWTRRRHLKFRKRLAGRTEASEMSPGAVVSAGV